MAASKKAFASVCIGLTTTVAMAPQCSGGEPHVNALAESEPDAGTPDSDTSEDDSSANMSASASATTAGIKVDAGISDALPLGCAGETTEAVPVPLDIYFMVDTSGSMLESTSDGLSKWEAVRQALESFFRSDALPALSVALEFFPQPKPDVPPSCSSDAQCGAAAPCLLRTCWNFPDGLIVPCQSDADCLFENALGVPVDTGPCWQFGACAAGQPDLADVDCIQACPADPNDCLPIDSRCINGTDCDPAVYQTPTVAMAPLATSVEPLVAALDGVTPDGSTPTASALSGAIEHLRQIAEASPDHQVVTVLATDGLPSEDCAEPNATTLDAAALEVADVAASGFSGTPSIRTFVIGVFAQAEAVDAERLLGYIAQAGGSDEAFIVETTGDVTSDFSLALAEIQNEAVSCDFEIPKPMSGSLDYWQVNVQLASGGDPETIFYVQSATDCDDAGGWYYDVTPQATVTPTHISLCPSSCDAFKSGGSSIDIQLGCETVIK